MRTVDGLVLYFAYLANTPNVRLKNPFLRTTDFAGRVGFGAAGLETYPFALPLYGSSLNFHWINAHWRPALTSSFGRAPWAVRLDEQPWVAQW